MPAYDYRCNACQNRFTLSYKSYAEYDAAHKQCPRCDSEDLSRLIAKINTQAITRDYGKMSSGEMLSVLESGDSKQVGQMFDQIGGGDPRLGVDYHETTQKLLKGQSMDKVEQDLQAKQKPNS